MKPITTWIVVADGAHARIVRNCGPGKGLEAIDKMVFGADHQPSRELGTDKPGRTFESVGHMRHAKQPRTDPHQGLKEEFANALAETLEKHNGSYDRVILVAPPAALGSLRSAIPACVADKVHGELVKDLTHTPNNELADHLQDLIAL